MRRLLKQNIHGRGPFLCVSIASNEDKVMGVPYNSTSVHQPIANWLEVAYYDANFASFDLKLA